MLVHAECAAINVCPDSSWAARQRSARLVRFVPDAIRLIAAESRDGRGAPERDPGSDWSRGTSPAVRALSSGRRPQVALRAQECVHDVGRVYLPVDGHGGRSGSTRLYAGGRHVQVELTGASISDSWPSPAAPAGGRISHQRLHRCRSVPPDWLCFPSNSCRYLSGRRAECTGGVARGAVGRPGVDRVTTAAPSEPLGRRRPRRRHGWRS